MFDLITNHKSQITNCRLTAAVSLSLLFLSSALIAQSPFVGPRSAGMAGAAVAVADDGTALWTNPAGFARDPRLDVDLFAGGVASNRNGFTAIVDELSSIDFSRLDPARVAAGVADLHKLAPAGTGVVASGVAGLVVAKWGWALGIGDLAFSGVYPDLDLVHVLPGNDPATGFFNNKSGIAFSGLEAREARLAYAMSFFEKVLLVGATARYIRGTTYFTRGSLFEEGSSDPAALARKALKENPLRDEPLRLRRRRHGQYPREGARGTGLDGDQRAGIRREARPRRSDPRRRARDDPAPAHAARGRRRGADRGAHDRGRLRPARDGHAGAGRQEPAVFAWAPSSGFPSSRSARARFHDSGAPDPHWAFAAGFGLGLKSLSINAAVVFSSEGGLSLSSTNRRDVGAALDARVRF